MVAGGLRKNYKFHPSGIAHPGLKGSLKLRSAHWVGTERAPWEAFYFWTKEWERGPLWVIESRGHPLLLLFFSPFFWPQPPGNTVVAVVMVAQWWRFSQQSRCLNLWERETLISHQSSCDPKGIGRIPTTFFFLFVLPLLVPVCESQASPLSCVCLDLMLNRWSRLWELSYSADYHLDFRVANGWHTRETVPQNTANTLKTKLVLEPQPTEGRTELAA